MPETAIFSGFMAIYGLFSLFVSIISLIFFVVRGFALFEMTKKLGIKNGWLSFVPMLSVFPLGKISEKYVKKDGSKSAKFGTLLLVFNILQYILVVVFCVFTVIAAIKIADFADGAILNDTAMELSMFSSLIPVIITYFVLMGIAIAYTIMFYIAVWRVFAIFDSNNSTLFTVLSVFFSFLLPIFLIIVRKKEPKIL